GRRHPAVRARQGHRAEDAQAAPSRRLPVVRRVEHARYRVRALVTKRFSLDQQIAVGTGATGKLGAVWVEALVEAGARVAALDLAKAAATPRFDDVAGHAGGGMARVASD